MLIFLCFGLIIFIYIVERFLSNKERQKNNFNSLMDKSDFENNITKSDLISFRHEFGETIFEIQKEIESLRLSIEDLKKFDKDIS